jgi:hypothetical protein
MTSRANQRARQTQFGSIAVIVARAEIHRENVRPLSSFENETQQKVDYLWLEVQWRDRRNTEQNSELDRLQQLKTEQAQELVRMHRLSTEQSKSLDCLRWLNIEQN